MTEKNNYDWNTKEKLIANTLEWAKEKGSQPGNSIEGFLSGLSTGLSFREKPIVIGMQK